jgi:hypothetical protein
MNISALIKKYAGGFRGMFASSRLARGILPVGSQSRLEVLADIEVLAIQFVIMA